MVHKHCVFRICCICKKSVCEEMEDSGECEVCNGFLCPKCLAENVIYCEACYIIACISCCDGRSGCIDCDIDLCGGCKDEHECPPTSEEGTGSE